LGWELQARVWMGRGRWNLRCQVALEQGGSERALC
jgi:hypothetical protein